MTNETKLWIPGTKLALKVLAEEIAQNEDFKIELPELSHEDTAYVFIKYKDEEYSLEWGMEEPSENTLFLYHNVYEDQGDEESSEEPEQYDVNAWATFDDINTLKELSEDVIKNIIDWYNSKED